MHSRLLEFASFKVASRAFLSLSKRCETRNSICVGNVPAAALSIWSNGRGSKSSRRHPLHGRRSADNRIPLALASLTPDWAVAAFRETHALTAILLGLCYNTVFQ